MTYTRDMERRSLLNALARRIRGARPMSAALSASCLVAALTCPESARAQACPGCVPLDDLGAGTYQGEQGGLYPGGSNAVPPAHAAAALHAARGVVPRAADGAPDPDGFIGVLGMGFSNLGQEWREVTRRVEADPGVGGHLVLIEGAINGGATPQLKDPAGPYWPVLDDRLVAAGVTHEQVQVVFLETSAPPVPGLTFPGSAEFLRDELAEVVRLIHLRLPNVRLVFLSTLIYAGYSSIWLTEPGNYEDGFGVKWLIEDQINGDPDLEYDPRRGPVRAPVLTWGPYLWANGATPRSDGLTWLPGDFESDGFHPSPSGEDKAAELFIDFIATSPAAQAVFRPRPGMSRSARPVDRDAGLDASRPNLALGAAPDFDVFEPELTSIVASSVGPHVGSVHYAKLALEPSNRSGQIEAVGLTDTTWDEAAVTASTAPAFDGVASRPIAIVSSETLAEWDVTQWVAATTTPAGGAVAFGLVKVAPTLLATFLSKEAGRPGWLSVAFDHEPGGIEPFCPGLPTSTGATALLLSTGSASLSAADLSFQLSNLPPLAVLLPLIGATPTSLQLAGGDVCVGGELIRLPLLQADSAGRASFTVDWSAPGTAVLAGDTRAIQAVFRDVVPSGYRTTSALVITFRP